MRRCGCWCPAAGWWSSWVTCASEHLAPVPVALAERLVRMFSFVGDTLLDPFVGTGSAMVACSLAGRNSIGVDIDEAYLALAQRRFQEQASGFSPSFCSPSSLACVVPLRNPEG